MITINVLGIDYGASNGRAIVGKFDGKRLVTEEVHKFPNVHVTTNTGMYWNIMGLFQELNNALAKTTSLSIPISSIGIDSWGVDFGLLDKQGNLLGNPRHYGDSRTDNIMSKVESIHTKQELFNKSGMTPHNRLTLAQLFSMKQREEAILENAHTLQFISGLLNYFLTGNISCDTTQASVSMLYSPVTNGWIYDFIEDYDLPDIFPPFNKIGTTVGKVLKCHSESTGVGQVPVILVAGHDTASAITAVPKQKSSEVCISSGTWSVVGTTINSPLINDEVLKSQFNNEAGYEGTMLVKNITGLWILQKCMREWQKKGITTDYSSLINYAVNSNFESYIDNDCAEFVKSEDTTRKIIEYCEETKQKAPQNREEVYMCIINGIARKYKQAINETQFLTGEDFNTIHMVGGGSRDKYLCKTTAKLANMKVIAGPYEATAVGNIVTQLISLGEIKNREEAMQIICDSFPLDSYNLE